MNAALQTYTFLSKKLVTLCQTVSKEEYFASLNELAEAIQRTQMYRLFPLDLKSEYVEGLKQSNREWSDDRIVLCRQLYLALATLMYRFEASNIYNRAYFDYMLELARTSLPYEDVNEWGKEYVQDMAFSHEGFFFATNRDKRFLQKTKEEYDEYCHLIRERKVPDVPIEKPIPSCYLSHLYSCYDQYYSEYCNCIEQLYPEIKELFRKYNMHLRIYLCSYDVSQDNPKIDFVLANFYKSNQRKVSVYPNYVDFAYRFCNIEEIADDIIDGCLCTFNVGDGEAIYNMVAQSSIFHEANMLFVQNASVEKLRNYVCYFLRGMLKPVKILEGGNLLYEETTVIFCDAEVSLEFVKYQHRSVENPHFIFVKYPSTSIAGYLMDNGIHWSRIFDYGSRMINNDNAMMVHWFIRDNIDELRNVQKDMGGQLLIEKLSQCKSGKLYWHDFELIGTDIFEYLFSSDFQEYQAVVQSSTDDGVQRRDLVVNNTFVEQSSFWGKMYSRYGSEMIIVDFKNYCDSIDSDCIYNVTKYMSTCVGCFVLIFSRMGVSDSGHGEQKRLLSEGKLVICLSDRDVIDMIQMKQSNKNPIRVVERLYFNLVQGV